ncbi:hypothetical protein FOMPIDRAFT_1123410 [Fomitopsis schrenkii]|uniref:C2H2-type domain-containing protein n=1 Tax=Fomitopsis schrenkii TaxID=2126942 RepID=S8E5J3_FOMSC|nr:hypothetical protein FOMPIDRAFT_1123410 [Fomitopsis schrenkii]
MLTSHQEHIYYDSIHNVCAHCNINFLTYDQLTRHLATSRKHHYCEECDEDYADEEELRSHYGSLHGYCAKCELLFDSARQLDKHNRNVHCHCSECDIFFDNHYELREHLWSTGHGGATVRCPGKKCRKVFVSGAALILHLESGACRSRVTRRAINCAAVKHDTEHVITIPARMLMYVEDNANTSVVATLATERSWNGSAYECFLCHREFKKLVGLNDHLRSPVHEERMYRCPLGYAGCAAEFKALSALCQHVESEKCGIRRFNIQMQDYLGDLTNNMKKLGI